MEPMFSAYLELRKKERRGSWNLAMFLEAGTRQPCPIPGPLGQDTCAIWDESPVPDGKPARKGWMI